MPHQLPLHEAVGLGGELRACQRGQNVELSADLEVEQRVLAQERPKLIVPALGD
jgi:hypothetical protein